MDGSSHLLSTATHQSIWSVKDHTKYVVRIAVSDDGKWMASAGYDKHIILYRAIGDGDEVTYQKIYSKHLKTNPEAIVFLPGSTHLVYTAREDNYLRYIKLEEDMSEPDETRYNLNPNGDDWVSFSILCIGIHPSLRHLSLQSDTPIARILVVPFHSSERLLTLFTSSEQSIYSNPRHSWLSSGAAVAVSSDDGIVRIVDLRGKVRAAIHCHGAAAPGEAGEGGEAVEVRRTLDKGASVVRDVCVVPGSNTVISVGLDRTVRLSEAVLIV